MLVIHSLPRKAFGSKIASLLCILSLNTESPLQVGVSRCGEGGRDPFEEAFRSKGDAGRKDDSLISDGGIPAIETEQADLVPEVNRSCVAVQRDVDAPSSRKAHVYRSNLVADVGSRRLSGADILCLCVDVVAQGGAGEYGRRESSLNEGIKRPQRGKFEVIRSKSTAIGRAAYVEVPSCSLLDVREFEAEGKRILEVDDGNPSNRSTDAPVEVVRCVRAPVCHNGETGFCAGSYVLPYRWGCGGNQEKSQDKAESRRVHMDGGIEGSHCIPLRGLDVLRGNCGQQRQT